MKQGCRGGTDHDRPDPLLHEEVGVEVFDEGVEQAFLLVRLVLAGGLGTANQVQAVLLHTHTAYY